MKKIFYTAIVITGMGVLSSFTFKNAVGQSISTSTVLADKSDVGTADLTK